MPAIEKFKILLVDDEQPFVEILAKRMRVRDLNVECVFNGAEALMALEKDTYDVVVLDVKMPGMDGIETLKKIKELDPGVEVIMLTGHATLDTTVEGMKHDAFDYLVKPIEIDSLIAKIREVYLRRHDLKKINVKPIGWK